MGVEGVESMEVADLEHQVDNKQDVAIWSLVQDELKRECGDDNYKSWLSKLQIVSAMQYIASFTVPTRFIRDWILTHYEKKILRSWQKYDNTIKKISITIDKTKKPTPSIKPYAVIEDGNLEKVNTQVVYEDYLPDYYLDKRFTFENFVVGPPNQFAYAAAKSVAEAKNVQSGSNPLFLYGGVGLGKTHLMHSIAWHIKNHNPSRGVIYISAEKFMYQFIRALRSNEIMQFKEKYRSIDVLMVDDIQFICGKESTQTEFFHTLNALIDSNRQIVISGDRSPTDLENMEERIKSRLGWGLVADIHNTTYELRLGILQSKAESLQANVPLNVLEFLAAKITSNVREVEGALNKVVAHANLTGLEITVDNTHSLLIDLLRANDRTASIEEIQKKVSERYGLKLSDMFSSKRSRFIARPRQIAMYMAKTLTNKSLAEIGKKFGGKDHTTVIHSYKTIDELIKTDKSLAEDIRVLTKVFQ